jgi:hypothetical protein
MSTDWLVQIQNSVGESVIPFLPVNTFSIEDQRDGSRNLSVTMEGEEEEIAGVMPQASLFCGPEKVTITSAHYPDSLTIFDDALVTSVIATRIENSETRYTVNIIWTFANQLWLSSDSWPPIRHRDNWRWGDDDDLEKIQSGSWREFGF